MKEARDRLWTRLIPEVQPSFDRELWRGHGGKWIIFDRRDRIVPLTEKLGPFIDAGAIVSAKYWNGDPSALCVYSLDGDREKTWEILQGLGAGDRKVWEYDYACGKNLQSPGTFLYSWSSKFITILRSYGIMGTIGLIRDVMRSE